MIRANKIKTFRIFICLLVLFWIAGDINLALGASSYRTRERRTAPRRKVVEEVVVEEVPLPPLKGPRKTIAVMDFENKAGADAKYQIGTGMAEMLTTALVKSGRFIVVERQAIQDVLAEQDFGATGRTRQAGAAKFGEILNSQILIRGAVTEFESRQSGGGQSFNIKGFSVGMSGANAHVAVNIRVTDATTGQVLDSQRCAGTAKASGLALGYQDGDWGVGTSGFEKTPLGDATQKAINKAVYFIVRRMESVSWEGRVVKADGKLVYLNAGSESNVLVGDEFDIYRAGEELIDPVSGINLGGEATKIGRVQVTEVQPKFSKATPIGGGGFQRNDLVREPR